jgi:hypothetical protein
MRTGELLTRATIWIAIFGYTFGSVIFALSRRRNRWDSAARIVWTIACLSLIAHVVCAFQYYHFWSHDAVYRETARQTEAVVGLNWGGGVFINYGLVLGWIVDIFWWWMSGIESYRRRPWPLIAVWHGFLIFIIFNATVVFKAGTVRWVGLCVSLSLLVAWLVTVRQWLSRSP